MSADDRERLKHLKRLSEIAPELGVLEVFDLDKPLDAMRPEQLAIKIRQFVARIAEEPC